VYVGGAFTDDIHIGGTTLTSSGGFDMYLASFDDGGSLRWVARYGSAGFGHDEILGLSTDAAGNVFLTGESGVGIDFGGGPIATASAMVLASFDGDGSLRWAHALEDAVGSGIATDDLGNVFVAALAYGVVDFGGGTIENGAVLVASWDNAGNYRWSTSFGSPPAGARTIAVDATGRVWVAGYFSYEIDFGAGPRPGHMKRSMFLLRFDGDGTLEFAHTADPAVQTFPGGVDVDSAGNVYVVGAYEGGVPDFGDGPLPDRGSHEGVFLVSHDSDGAFRWSRDLGRSLDGTRRGVACSSEGQIVTAGDFVSTDLPPATSGPRSALTLAFDTDGSYLWGNSITGTGSDRAYAVDATPDGHVVVAGTFQRTVDFGDMARTATGISSVFLLSLN